MGQTDIADKILMALNEAPKEFSDQLFEKPVIQEIINQRWNLVKTRMKRLLLIPFCIYLSSYGYYVLYFNRDPSHH